MRPATPCRLALATLLATGCAAKDFAMEGADSGGGMDTADVAQLRIDVFPSSATPDLQPQSWVPTSSEWTGLDVQVRGSVRLTGTVKGFVATPPIGGQAPEPQVPGRANSPVDARLELFQEDRIGGTADVTDDEGLFELVVPPGPSYRLDVVPSDPGSLPFATYSFPLLDASAVQHVTLDYGVPVFGRVLENDGTPVTRGTIHLVDLLTGVESGEVELDEAGHYMIRAYPGDYQVVLEGEAGYPVPSLSALAAAEDEIGAELDFDVGDLREADVKGTVVGADGTALRNVDMVVRFTSVDLDYALGTFEVETSVDPDGDFAKTLLPGRWNAEFIPAYGQALSPAEMEIVVGTGTTDLGEVSIADPVLFVARVLDVDGRSAAGVLVTAREVGFDNYAYSATTGDDGQLSLSVPPVPLLLTITPSDDDGAITHTTLDAATVAEQATLTELNIVPGLPVSGTLRSGESPVAWALIEVRDGDGELLASTIAGEEGEFSLRVEW